MRSTAYGLETPREATAPTPCSINGSHDPHLWEFVGTRLNDGNREARQICRTECHGLVACRVWAETSGAQAQLDGQIVAGEVWLNGQRADVCACGRVYVRRDALALCSDCRRSVDKALGDG